MSRGKRKRRRLSKPSTYIISWVNRINMSRRLTIHFICEVLILVPTKKKKIILDGLLVRISFLKTLN